MLTRDKKVCLTNVAEAAEETSVINVKVLQNMQIMYQKVPYKLQCKYLIYQIFKGVFSQMRGAYEHILRFLNHPLIQQEGLDELLAYFKKKSGKISQKNSNYTILLNEQHLTFLFKCLSDHSHKWENIGRILQYFK